MKVVVTDGSNRVALAVVRALGEAGAEVTVVEQERFARRPPAAFASRHAAHVRVIPSIGWEDRFLDGLARACEGHDVVLPVSTNVLLACANHAGRLPARCPVPAPETIRRANDKSSVLAVARKAGVPVPVGYAPENEEELEEIVGRIRYPAVVKLRDDEGTWLDPGDRYARVDDGDALRAAWRRLHAVRRFPVVQERVEGDGHGVGVLARDGEVLASFCHRREREYPVSGGPSACCVSVRDPVLTAHAAAVIRELGWTGIAQVEFKGAGDRARLLEVNPRFWGSLPLATRAGINFPWMACLMATGADLPSIPEYAEGIRVRFLPMDLAAARSGGRHFRGMVRDLFDRDVTDGILRCDDWRASLAYLMGRIR